MDLTSLLVPDQPGFSLVIKGVTYRTLRRDAGDNLLVAVGAPFTPTSIGNGQLTGFGPFIPTVLPDQACRAVSIAALPNNTGNIYLGDGLVSSANGRILPAGASIDIAIANLNLLYITCDVGGEGISYLWVA